MDGTSTSPIPALRVTVRACCLVAFLMATSALAEALPLRVQAVLIEKILLFDRTLPAGEKPMVALVYGDELDQAELLHKALAELRINSALVNGSDLRPMPAAKVLYVFPKAWTTALKDWAMQRKALSFCAEPNNVRSGQAAVALSMEDRKPRILVNLTVAKALGHDLSSELLSVATVVK